MDYWLFSLLCLLPYFLLKRTIQKRRTGPTALLHTVCEKWTHSRQRETKIICSFFYREVKFRREKEEEIILKYSWWARGGGVKLEKRWSEGNEREEKEAQKKEWTFSKQTQNHYCERSQWVPTIKQDGICGLSYSCFCITSSFLIKSSVTNVDLAEMLPLICNICILI